MNVLYVGTLPPHRGGSAILAAQLLPHIARAGHQVRALAPLSPDVAQPVDTFALSQPAISITRYPMGWDSTSRVAGSSDAAFQLAERRAITRVLPELLTQVRPDVVIMGRESVAWHASGLVAQHALPSILLIQGGSTFARLVSSLDEPYRELRDLLGKVDRIVTVADHLADPLRRRLHLENVVTIPNPVDLDRFAPSGKDGELLRALRVSGEDTVIMHVSNLRELKRPLDIVRSAELCLRENPGLVYVIVGDGVCRVAMARLSDRAGIADRMRFVGWVDHERVAAYLNVADVVLLTSEAEGQSLVALEAQACARALLASDITGAREIVTDGETGVLYRSGDIEDLAAKTLSLAENHALRAVIGRQAREGVRGHAIERIASAYLEVMDDVVRT